MSELSGELRYAEAAPGQAPLYYMTGSVRGRTADGHVGFIGNPMLLIEGAGVEQVLLPESRTGYSSKENLLHLSGRPTASLRVYVQAGTRKIELKVVGLP